MDATKRSCRTRRTIRYSASAQTLAARCSSAPLHTRIVDLSLLVVGRNHGLAVSRTRTTTLSFQKVCSSPPGDASVSCYADRMWPRRMAHEGVKWIKRHAGHGPPLVAAPARVLRIFGRKRVVLPGSSVWSATGPIFEPPYVPWREQRALTEAKLLSGPTLPVTARAAAR